MPAALTPIAEGLGERRIEDHDRLGRQAAVLGRAEGQDVDAAFPRHLGRRAAQGDEGVGETRPVHVHLEAVPVRDLRQRRDLRRSVDEPGFRRLRDREPARRHLLDASRQAREERLERRRRDLGADARQPGHLGAMHVELGRAALVVDDVRLDVRDREAVGRHDRRQRQRVGAGPGRGEEGLNLALEQRAEALLHPGGDLVRPISRKRAAVGAHERFEDGGARAHDVVAGEVHPVTSRPRHPQRRPRGCQPVGRLAALTAGAAGPAPPRPAAG